MLGGCHPHSDLRGTNDSRCLGVSWCFPQRKCWKVWRLADIEHIDMDLWQQSRGHTESFDCKADASKKTWSSRCFPHLCFDTRSMSEAALDIFAEVSQKKLFQQVEVNEPAKHRHDEIHWNTEKQVKRKIPSRRKKSVKDEHSHWTFKIKSLNTYR